MESKPADYYDEIFTREKGFNTHYKDSYYYVHWTQVISYLKRIQEPAILEVGCGTGQLAHYLFDEGYKNYCGFDFSHKAIELAKERVDQKFFVADALHMTSYDAEYNTVVCLEVLEHIGNDLGVLELINTGTKIVFSVPNFDTESHVRWFLNERQIKSRYYKIVDFESITRIGNIYICFGVISPFNPTLGQRILKSREKVNLFSFYNRIKHRLYNWLKIKQS